MANPLIEILERQGFVVLDGALATELERRGADLDDPLWSARILLENPDLIRDVHLDYFRAGADCATTASYQATVEGFAQRGLSGQEALELIRLSVKLAVEARDRFWAEQPTETHRLRPFIAGSVGPYGAFLADGSEYRGAYGLTEADLIAFHRPRVDALLEAGVDILACETIPSFLEARALARLLEAYPDASAWISFSARDGGHTSEGDEIAGCAAFLDEIPQVAAIGINCTAPRFIPDLLRAIRGAARKPIVVYPNSGERYDVGTRSWLGETSCDAYGDQAAGWYAAGARLIGGCCRTTPEHIAHVAAELRSLVA